MNISNELLKTSIWKGINDSNKHINGEEYEKGLVKVNRKIVKNVSEDLDIPLIDQTSKTNTNENLKKNTKS